MRESCDVNITVLSYRNILTENILSLEQQIRIRGWELIEIEPHELTFRIGLKEDLVMYRGDAIFPAVVIHRTVSKFMSLVKPILEHWKKTGSMIINDPIQSMYSRSKFDTAVKLREANIPLLPSEYFFQHSNLEFRDKDPIVVKPIYGARGRDISFFDNGKNASDFYKDFKTVDQKLLVEPFLKQKDLGADVEDIRAHVVDGVCVALMKRIPSPGSRIANLAEGGTGVPLSLNHPATALAERAAQSLQLDVAGVDILRCGDDMIVSEVDAWAGYAGIERVTGVSVSEKILDMIDLRSSKK